MTQLKVWHKLAIGLLLIALVAIGGFLIAFILVNNNNNNSSAGSKTTTTTSTTPSATSSSEAMISRIKILPIEASDNQPIPFPTTMASSTPTGTSPISKEFVELPRTSQNYADAIPSQTTTTTTTTPPPEITTVILQPLNTDNNNNQVAPNQPQITFETTTTPSPVIIDTATTTTSSPELSSMPMTPTSVSDSTSLGTSVPTTSEPTTQITEDLASTTMPTKQVDDDVTVTPIPPSPSITDAPSTTFSDMPTMGDTMITSASTPPSTIVVAPYSTTTPTTLSTLTSTESSINEITNSNLSKIPETSTKITEITDGNRTISGSFNEYQMSRWADFMTRFPKPYQDVTMLNMRREIFMQNLAYIDQFNADPTNTLFRLGVNQFADMTTDEINMLFIGLPQSWSSLLAQLISPPVSLRSTVTPNEPDFVNRIIDWRNLTIPMTVNQGDCRDGAAFAILANIEAVYNKQMQTLRNNENNNNNNDDLATSLDRTPVNPLKLSEHQILNCMRISQKSGDMPVCSGHLSMINLLEKLQSLQDHTLISDSEYARISATSPLTCALSSQQEMELRSPRVRVTGFNQLHANDILEALDTIGPLTVAIDATKPTFHFYESGLYQDNTCSEGYYNHHLLLVGYSPGLGAQTDKPAYLARNSFGGAWGEGGYIRMLDRETNSCLPKNMAIYPNIEVLG